MKVGGAPKTNAGDMGNARKNVDSDGKKQKDKPSEDESMGVQWNTRSFPTKGVPDANGPIEVGNMAL